MPLSYLSGSLPLLSYLSVMLWRMRITLPLLVCVGHVSPTLIVALTYACVGSPRGPARITLSLVAHNHNPQGVSGSLVNTITRPEDGQPPCLWHSRVRQPRTRARILTPATHPPKSHDASLATRCQPHRRGDQPPNPSSPLAPPLPTAAVIPKRGHFHSPAHIYRWSGQGGGRFLLWS